MERLIEFTGGSIYITIAAFFIALIGLITATINLIVLLIKNDRFTKKKKIEAIVLIICILTLSSVISGTIGYYVSFLVN